MSEQVCQKLPKSETDYISFPPAPTTWSVKHSLAYNFVQFDIKNCLFDIKNCPDTASAHNYWKENLKEWILYYIDSAVDAEIGISLTVIFLSLHDVQMYLSGIFTQSEFNQIWHELEQKASGPSGELNSANLFSASMKFAWQKQNVILPEPHLEIDNSKFTETEILGRTMLIRK